MNLTKAIFNDGFCQKLVDGARMDGKDGIPTLMGYPIPDVPKSLVPFDKMRSCQDKKAYVHFYIHDRKYGEIFSNPDKYDSLLSQFEGLITPDPTIILGKSRCLHTISTYRNRALGFYEQKKGRKVICNVRWGDPSTYDFCFLGVPKHSIIAISTHGAIKKDKYTNNSLRNYFKRGLGECRNRLVPRDVIVYGRMPEDIFGPYKNWTHFHLYPSEFEKTHRRGI